MGHARHGLIVDPFALQHRSDLIAARRVHQLPAAQIRYAGDVRPARHQNDGRGALEDDSQHDQPASRDPFAQNAGTANAEIRFDAGDRLRNVNTGTALADGDVETGVTVETLFQCGVVTSELELVLPLELQRYCIERSGGMRCQQHQASGDDQPFQSVPLLGTRGEQPSGRRSANGLDELVSSHVTPPSAFSLRGGVVTRGVPLFENWPEKATHAPIARLCKIGQLERSCVVSAPSWMQGI